MKITSPLLQTSRLQKPVLKNDTISLPPLKQDTISFARTKIAFQGLSDKDGTVSVSDNTNKTTPRQKQIELPISYKNQEPIIMGRNNSPVGLRETVNVGSTSDISIGNKDVLPDSAVKIIKEHYFSTGDTKYFIQRLDDRQNNYDVQITDYKKGKNVYLKGQGAEIKPGENLIINDLRFVFNDDKLLYTGINLFPVGIQEMRFSQGDIGDCVFLSSLKSLANNPTGRRLIDSMINTDLDLNTEVVFPGKPNITINYKNLPNKNTDKMCHEGDMGVKILERSYSKLCKQCPDRFLQKLFSGGLQKAHDENAYIDGLSPSVVLEDLTGVKPIEFKDRQVNYRQNVEGFFEFAGRCPERFCTVVGTKRDMEPVILKQDNWQKFYIVNQHAYTLDHVDPFNKEVYLVNPHVSDRVGKLSYEEFFKHFDTFSTVDMEKVEL